MSLKAHRHAAVTRVAVLLLTFSDTRDLTSDTTGRLIGELLEAAGHEVVSRSIVREETKPATRTLERALGRRDCQALICNGGTGVAPHDITPELIRPLLDRELPGFGELFRQLSYQQIGSAALLSRALAGLAGEKVVFALPGSSQACRLALEALILPELGHLVAEATKGRPAVTRPSEGRSLGGTRLKTPEEEVRP